MKGRKSCPTPGFFLDDDDEWEKAFRTVIGRLAAAEEREQEEQEQPEDQDFLHMLPERFGSLIQDGIQEGQRFAISSDLWRYASATPHCDLLLTLHPMEERDGKKACAWIVDMIKQYEPLLKMEVRYHRLKDCYAIYFTADYKSLLKGAELCHLKKPVKNRFGGGLRDFVFEDAQCFAGIEMRNSFLSGMERALIVKQMVDMVRAPRHGLGLRLHTTTLAVPEGMAVVPILRQAGIVDSVLPLHNTDYLKLLQQKWVLAFVDQQPLELIKDYYGTEIAMYFAWLGHMTTALWFPAVLGLIMFFFGGFKYKHTKEDLANMDSYQLFSDICFVLFAFFNCVWATGYLESWKRRQAELAFQWGTYTVETDSYLQDPRPAFQGDYLAPNPVSGRMEPFYPAWKHAMIRYCLTYPVTFVCVGGMFCTMLLIFVIQDKADYYFAGSWLLYWVRYIPMVAYALIIVVSDKLYRRLALCLNDLENYRTDDEYEDFLISKIVIFQFVTAFGSLFYIAFVLRDMKRLQETLATLLITRQVTQNVMETAVPFFMERFKLSALTYKMTRSMSDNTLKQTVERARRRRRESDTGDDERTVFDVGSPKNLRRRVLEKRHSEEEALLGDEPSHAHPHSSNRIPIPEFKPQTDGTEVTQAELESHMSIYARPLDDYLEMFIQFGYVLLFSPAFPLAAVCALANNLIEIRVDAFKLCNTVQRPFGRQVKDIGAWQKAMELLGMAGVMVNCALIGQSGLVQRIWPDLSWGGQILIVVVLEHVILAAKIVVDMAVPDVPHWIRIENAKQEHFRREAFKREQRMLSSSRSPDGLPPACPSDPRPLEPRPSKRRSVTPLCRMSTASRASHGNMNIDA